MTASVPRTAKQRSQGAARFPRAIRLLRHADFERVYKQGHRKFSANMTVFYLRREPGPTDSSLAQSAGLRVGFTVGRALGGAVQRNRMKRRLREAVRLAPPPRQLCADVVVNPKKSVLTADFESVLNEIRSAFVAIEQRISNRLSTIAEEGQISPSRKAQRGDR